MAFGLFRHSPNKSVQIWLLSLLGHRGRRNLTRNDLEMFHLKHLKGAFRLATDPEWEERAEFVGTPLNKTSLMTHAFEAEWLDRRVRSKGIHFGFHFTVLPNSMFNRHKNSSKNSKIDPPMVRDSNLNSLRNRVLFVAIPKILYFCGQWHTKGTLMDCFQVFRFASLRMSPSWK